MAQVRVTDARANAVGAAIAARPATRFRCRPNRRQLAASIENKVASASAPTEQTPLYLNGCNVWPTKPEHLHDYPRCTYRFVRV